MAESLRGKTAFVTGAGRGIGRSIALALAREGAAVVAVARTLSEIESVASEIVGAGGRAIAVEADVAREHDITRSIERAVAELGAVDILINNAGSNVLGRLAEQDPRVWWEQLEVNLRAPYLYCRAVVPRMVERGWGRVINVSSTAGKIGLQYCTAYCAAKHGIIGFTRALALEVADKGVTVNAVCPGLVETRLSESTLRQRAELFQLPLDTIRKVARDRSPQRRVVTPDELAPAVLFLVSDGAAGITGESLNLSGGQVTN